MSRYTLVMGNKNYSSWSLRPWLVMKHLGLEFDEIVIALMQDGFKDKILTHSPAGKVPVLKVDDFCIWDSLAICEYLNDSNPGAGLWPVDVQERALARSVAAEMHSGFFIIRNEMPMNIRRVVDDFSVTPECQLEIERVKDIWQNCLARKAQAGPFLFGGFTIADAMYAPIVWRFNSYGVALEGPLQDYSEAIRDFAPMQQWVEAAQDEAWVIDQAEV
ncbi:glutathione S-transferase family protein [Terasakiella pusilla]|uniref:glutathione S-transferase family protein n=1 Tax=Terasakiella pusilla TaxID=64973 RepID=UPI003AA7BC62